ncbi:hypothetical protein EMIHUDRAFT_243960 [Emiliania huxleyi CCMP1516]|uniref:Uncharacterized protein n=2 Tax=Emiliania huxleyi TaxID=2903 RepID=A0A0D3J271_EMIH1|nr:hypothetical protein EMIHUDRAFT_243960 [Emiliania huxleyi CCMP1516]EOD17606.1 hypothetical protein EMIHUDRAFT_243960 [Emiliania huxleyi CCMP1516]|eukprot:XP_005770035.1 hypothetical protein EMIHUDRAFT_243960 [Emiliania huxleyi CCMP1516]
MLCKSLAADSAISAFDMLAKVKAVKPYRLVAMDAPDPQNTKMGGRWRYE